LFFLLFFAPVLGLLAIDGRLRTHFWAAYYTRLVYVFMAYVKNTLYADVFLAYKVIAFSLRDPL